MMFILLDELPMSDTFQTADTARHLWRVVRRTADQGPHLVYLSSDGLASLSGHDADLLIENHLRQQIAMHAQQFAQPLSGFTFVGGAPHRVHHVPATLSRDQEQFKDGQPLAGVHRIIVP